MEFLNGLTMGRRRFSALAIPRSGLRLSITNNGDGTATFSWSGFDLQAADEFGLWQVERSTNGIDWTQIGDNYSPEDSSATIEINNATPYRFRVHGRDEEAIVTFATSNIVGPLTITGDTAAAAWIAAEETADYTFSAGEKDATHTAFSLLRSNDLLDKLYRLQLLCLGSSARNEIPLVGSGGSFGAGVTHNTKSVTYSGTTTGFIDPNFTPSTGGWSLASSGFGYYLSTSRMADESSIHGCTSTTNGTIQAATRFPSIGTFVDFGNATNRMAVAGTGLKGLRNFLKISETTGYVSRYDEDGANELASKTNMSNANAALPTVPFYFGARNNNGTVDVPSTETHGLIWLGGNGMTTADRDIFDVIMYNLLDAFGAL